MRFHWVLAVGLSLLAVACGSSTPTSPSTPAPLPVAPATISETYSSTLPVGASKFYSFSVVANGTVNLTLQTLTGPSIGSDVTVELALGRPVGTGCSATTAVTVSTDTAAPHVTGTYLPGVYCVRVTDTGNLPAAASFAVLIEHS